MKTEDDGKDIKREYAESICNKRVDTTSDARKGRRSDLNPSQQLQTLITIRNARVAKVEALSLQILAGERGLGVLTRQLYETQIAINRRELEIDRLTTVHREEMDSLQSCEDKIAQLRESGGSVV